MLTPAQRTALVMAAIAVMAPLTMKYEGKENIGYADKLANGKPTTCYGSTKGVVVGKYYSDEECNRRFADDAKSHGTDVSACLPDYVSFNPVVLAAMIDAGYNLGTTTFCKSSMVKRAQAGDMRGACDATLLYKKAGGKDCSNPANKCIGLWKRRKEFHALCLRGLSQ